MILRHGTLRGLRNGWLEPSGRMTQRRFLSDTNGNAASSKGKFYPIHDAI